MRPVLTRFRSVHPQVELIGLQALNLTLDFDETEVLQANMEYLVSTLEVSESIGGPACWRCREGGFTVIGGEGWSQMSGMWMCGGRHSRSRCAVAGAFWLAYPFTVTVSVRLCGFLEDACAPR